MLDQLNILFHAAQDNYLKDSDLDFFETSVENLETRLNLYRQLRESEEKIFQRVALSLREEYPKESPQRLQQALKHWILVLRYCSMAMLIDSPDFLKYRLLEWLPEVIVAHNLQDVEGSLFQLLKRRLKKFLSSEEIELLNPYLMLAKETLLEAADSNFAFQFK
ncbi:MAG: phycobilisome protein [Synechococcus sp.]